MRIQLTAVLVLLFQLALNAQFETTYKPIVSHGTLPKDFVTLSSKKYEEARAKLSKSEKRSLRKSKENFLLQTNFSIDEMLLSGRVLFNDPLADFVNKVADKALSGDPATRQALRFYVLKSSAVNAFATNQGVVCVTMGMLAQVENEAELAFVLCHEAVHYKEQHAINKYLEADKVQRGKGAYKQMTLDEKFISKCSFSKEQEKEADEKGLQLFLKSNYSTENLMGVYDVLKYSYLPFDDIDFDKAFLENNTLKFPDTYVQKETKAITTATIDDDDERSTHPNLKSRRQGTQDAIAGANNAGKSDYLVGESRFNEVREMARFELSRIYTLNQRYELGIYNSYMLLKKYPNNLYLKKNVAYCLAGLAQYSSISEFKEVHKDYIDIEGKQQAVYFLMNKLDENFGDLTTVAVAYIAKLKTEYPKDKEITELFNSQVRTLVGKNHLLYSDFSRFAPTPAEVVDSVKAAEYEKLVQDSIAAAAKNAANDKPVKSKYDKLRELETGVALPKGSGIVTGGRFIKYALVDYMNEPWFKDAFDKADKASNDVTEIVIDDDVNYRYRYRENKTYALGLDKIVIVDPYFARINATKKSDYKYLQSEAGQVDFAERLKANAKTAKLEVEVLNTKNLEESECEKVNDIAIMEEYISERLDHKKGVNLPYAERERLLAIAEKYGTDHFMWTGTISLTDISTLKRLVIPTAIVPVILPFTLPAMINRGQYTIYFALVYNVATDKLEYSTFREINNRTRGYILDSHIYDVFNQIKTKAKKK